VEKGVKMAHDKADLSFFQKGEVRLVYARNREGIQSELFYLEDGSAEAMRAFTKSNLECFMQDCPDRRLTTVSRGKRRDGFRHFVGSGGHSEESLLHEQSKALLLRWINQNYPHLEATEEKSTNDRSRRADVMVTWPEGHQLAIEVQYSPISISEFWERHNSYLSQGISCTWLFGYLPPHLKFNPYFDKQVALASTQQDLAIKGIPLMWINPVSERIASLTAERIVHACEIPFCKGDKHMSKFLTIADGTELSNSLALASLFDCALTPAGIETPSGQEAAWQKLLLDIALKSEELRITKETEIRLLEEQERAWIRAERASTQVTVRSHTISPPLKHVMANPITCKACGYPLDPVFAGRGFHFSKECEKQIPESGQAPQVNRE